MPGDYQPIACQLHDIYEIAIMRGQHLELEWQQDGQRHKDTLRPTDLQTANGAEWLVANDATQHALRLRLDWISRAEPVVT